MNEKQKEYKVQNLLQSLRKLGIIERDSNNQLVALLDNQYKIKSNRESGDGRYDISLFPRNDRNPGIIMELKSEKGLNDTELDTLSMEALDQIDDKRYDMEMENEGIGSIIRLGIGFSGKKVKIKTR